MSKKFISMKYKIALMRMDMTQREAANILGFSESYISMLISGQRTNENFDNWLKDNVYLDDLNGAKFNAGR